MSPLYLDYNATTPIDPRVFTAMEPYLRDQFGNPSSDHPYGETARRAVAQARKQVSTLLGADPATIVFTGTGSEANNLALKGVASSYRTRGNHIITSAIEHPAISAPLQFLERQGYAITVLPVDPDGLVHPADVVAAMTDQTILISIMHANNEVGTIQPIRAIAELAHARGVLVHTDAAQTIGKLPVDVDALGVDLLTVVGHKFGAPKGIGALFVRQNVVLEPLVHGAGHEAGRRAGTENVPYIVALGAAAELAHTRIPIYQQQVQPLRDHLQAILQTQVPTSVVNGHPTARLPNTLNISFPGTNAAMLVAAIQGEVACSTGSACHAGHAAPSPVLLAMGRDPLLAAAALRLSLGWQTTATDVDQAADHIVAALRTLIG